MHMRLAEFRAQLKKKMGSREPLLRKGDVQRCQGCTACEVEEQKKQRTGYPVKEFAIVGLVVLCNALPISSLFPFLYFMVKDFQIAKEVEDIGIYAGILASSFMVGRFCTSFLWGMAADKYGRKPVLIVGAISVVIYNTLFGFSANYWMAILIRFLLGAFNGLIGTIKAYVAEVARQEHQAMGLSIVSTTWGIGLIIGPAIGGFLAQPAEKYPKIFAMESIFGKYPYLLPCLCISLIGVVVVFVSFFLPETLHKHPIKEEEKVHNIDIEKDGSILNLGVPIKEYKGEVIREGKFKRLKSILIDWPIMSTIIIFCIYSFHDIAYSEIFSLWAVSPISYGGLGFSTNDVGEILAISGIGLLIIQLMLFPSLEKIVGPIFLIRATAVISIPVLTIYPFIAMLRGIQLWIAINVASLIKNILAIMTITGTHVLLNNAVDDDRRATANGLQMSAMSFFKAIGPTGAGIVFSWSQKRQHADFFPGFHLVCLFLNIVVIIFVFMTLDPILPRSTNKPVANAQRNSPHEEERHAEEEERHGFS